MQAEVLVGSEGDASDSSILVTDLEADVVLRVEFSPSWNQW
jgi:hypothetical protein